MIRSVICVILLALSLTACDEDAGPANRAGNINAGNTNSPASNAANKPANANAATPFRMPAERISFPQGKNVVIGSTELDPGDIKQFVVAVKKGQVLSIDSLFKPAVLTPINTGIDKGAHNKPGRFETTITADGDFVFEVSNNIKDSFKTVLTLTVK